MKWWVSIWLVMSWLYKAKVQAYWLICFKGFRDWRIWAPLSIMCCPIVMGSPCVLWSPKLSIGLGDLFFFFFFFSLFLICVRLQGFWEEGERVFIEREKGEKGRVHGERGEVWGSHVDMHACWGGWGWWSLKAYGEPMGDTRTLGWDLRVESYEVHVRFWIRVQVRDLTIFEKVGCGCGD